MLLIYKNPSVVDLRSRQKGISLIIVFFAMTILLATVLSISTIVVNEVKIVGNASNAVSSFYSSDSGIEKTLYYARKQIPAGGYTGICNICNACTSADCQSCTTTPLAAGGCDLVNCNNCQVSYQSSFNNRTYTINATISPDADPSYSLLSINSKGVYNSTARNLSLSQRILIPASNGITLIQKAKNTGSGSVSATWPKPTTAGDFLVAVISNGEAILPPTEVTAPAGWTKAVTNQHAGGGGPKVTIFYRENAPTQASTGNFITPGFGETMSIVVAEYSGVALSNSLDRTASVGDQATSAPITGTTLTTTQAKELVVGGIGSRGGAASNPANGFSILDQMDQGFNAGNAIFLQKMVSSTGAYGSSVNTATSNNAAGAIATFKAGSAPPLPPTITSINPQSATAGGSAFTLTVNGSNFAADSIVRWNGSNRSTNFVNSGTVTASISAADIATTMNVAVTVMNTSSGLISNSATFTVNPGVPPPPSLLVQSAINFGTTSVSVNWERATGPGDLLVAVVGNGMTTGNQGNVTAPGGWTRAISDNYSSGGGPRITIFYKANAPSQTSTGAFTASGTGEAMTVIVAEYSNISITNPLDKTASLGNQLTRSPVTGTTNTTVQGSELLIGAIATRGGTATFIANGFSTVGQLNQGGNVGNVIMLQNVVTSTGAYSTSITTSASGQAAGAIATFKAVFLIPL